MKRKPKRGRKSYTAFAVVEGGAIVAQKWNEQFCVYTSRKEAEKSIRDFHTKRLHEVVREVRITVMKK